MFARFTDKVKVEGKVMFAGNLTCEDLTCHEKVTDICLTISMINKGCTLRIKW